MRTTISDQLTLYRNFGIQKTPAERKSATEEQLHRSCECQRDIVAHGIRDHHAFELWAAKWLERHFHQILSGAADAVALTNPKIVSGRTTDLYSGQSSTDKPRSGSVGKLTPRGSHLEILVHRYLALLGEKQRVRSVDVICGGFGGENGATLKARMLAGAQREADERDRWLATHKKPNPASDTWDVGANKWTVRSLSTSVFSLLSANYILDLANYTTKGTQSHQVISRLVTECLDATQSVVLVNAPGQVKIANARYRSSSGVTANELLYEAQRATADAAQRYHPLHAGGGFATYCKRTIATHLRRLTLGTRAISMPEEKILAVRRLQFYRTSQDSAAGSLADQMKAAGINNVSEKEMEERLRSEQESQTLSVDQLAEGIAETAADAARYTEHLLSDRGAGADQVRAANADDPTITLLRSTFRKLHPLHQGILTSLYSCTATDGGDLAWFDAVERRSAEVISAAVNRIVKGAASPRYVARSLACVY